MAYLSYFLRKKVFNQILSSINLMPKMNNASLNWIGKIIRNIVEKPAYGVGIGIILFTLILKLITLPFDILSRVSTKKNSLKMEQIRPELERLQKQYSNNKQLYQQKVMALQKQAGYSPLASCLPSILTIVIFILVINQFSAFSTYSSRKIFKQMAEGYNAKIIQLSEGSNPLLQQNGELYYINRDNATYTAWLDTNKITNIEGDSTPLITLDGDNAKFNLSTEDYVDKFYNLQKTYYEDVYGGAEFFTVVDDKATSFNGTDSQNIEITNKVLNVIEEEIFVPEYVYSVGQEKAKEIFNKEKDSFLWIKNVWTQDVTYKHPLGGYDSKTCKGLGKDNYKILTAKMKTEKTEPNGYFILIVLSIGVMVLSQMIMSKDQKSQVELGTVDGENGTAGQTQKIMKYMMPIMYGIFAFIYTSAFSIYMIVSSLFSTLSTIIISLIVTKAFENKKEQMEQARINKRYTERKKSMEKKKK